MVIDVYSRLRRLVGDLREFGEMEAQAIADHIGMSPASLSRFMSGDQETVTHAVGAAIESLHETHQEEIKKRKIAKAQQLLVDLGHPPIDFG